jgi:hypothetical protein
VGNRVFLAGGLSPSVAPARYFNDVWVLNLTPTPAWSHGSDAFFAECGGQKSPPSDCPASGGVGAAYSGIGLSAYTYDPGKNRILFYGGSSTSSQHDCVLRELRLTQGQEGFKVVASTTDGSCSDNFDSVIYHAASFDNIRERFFRVGFSDGSPDVRAAYYPLAAACCRTGTDCQSGQFCNRETSLCDTCTGKPNGTSCSDGDVCNGAETCQSGACTAGTPPALGGGEPFTMPLCDPVAGPYLVRFRYRQQIDVTNPGAEALTDYQVQIPSAAFNQASLVSQGKLLPTRHDLVVTTLDGTLLAHYVERVGFTVDGATPGYTLWAKVPSLPPGITSLFIFYGQSGSGALPQSQVANTFIVPEPECAGFESAVRYSDSTPCWDETLYAVVGGATWAFFPSYETATEASDGVRVGFLLLTRTEDDPNGTNIDFVRHFDLPLQQRYALRYDAKQFADHTTPGRASFSVQDEAGNALSILYPAGNQTGWHYGNDTSSFVPTGPHYVKLSSHIGAPGAGGLGWWYIDSLRFRRAAATPELEPTAVANGGEQTAP